MFREIQLTFCNIKFVGIHGLEIMPFMDGRHRRHFAMLRSKPREQEAFAEDSVDDGSDKDQGPHGEGFEREFEQ